MAAADHFIQVLADRAYAGAIRSMTKILERGPAGRKPRSKLVQLHQWYVGLRPEDQQQVLQLIGETARHAVFGCFVVLDNKQGGYPVSSVLSDYAVYLQTYADETARGRNEANLAVRLNPAYGNNIDLHDRFMELIEDDARK
jgi:hypothetical protein